MRESPKRVREHLSPYGCFLLLFLFGHLKITLALSVFDNVRGRI